MLPKSSLVLSLPNEELMWNNSFWPPLLYLHLHSKERNADASSGFDCDDLYQVTTLNLSSLNVCLCLAGDIVALVIVFFQSWPNYTQWRVDAVRPLHGDVAHASGLTLPTHHWHLLTRVEPLPSCPCMSIFTPHLGLGGYLVASLVMPTPSTSHPSHLITQ